MKPHLVTELFALELGVTQRQLRGYSLTRCAFLIDGRLYRKIRRRALARGWLCPK